MNDLPILYRVAEGGPFDLEVDNGVTIENITDDLVNAKILIPDTRLQTIANTWGYDSVGQGRHEFREQWSELAVLLDALIEEDT